MKLKKPKKKESAISKYEPFKPLKVTDIGTDRDPCFGKIYNLASKECKMCGDSELCCVVFAQKQNTTRDKLNEEKNYKDLQTLIDIKGVKKFMRGKIRKGESRKEILESTMKKFDLAKDDARTIYKQLKPKN